MVVKKLLAAAALAVFGAVAAGPADAHRPRASASIGIHIGTPGFAYSYRYGHPRPYYRSYYGPYFPRHYYYAPAPLIVVPPEPTVYIERPQAPAAAATNYWYYCAESNAYYPYVQQCAGAWQPVPPTPQR